MLDENVVRRLALVKYLYRTGVEQSKLPEPICAFSILTFHDAIELFLILASEFHDTGARRNIHLMDYWEKLSRKNINLTLKESIRRLKEARNSLKHDGILPSKLEIEAFRATATNFFEENTPIVFGINFSDISLTALVANNEAREYLKRAEKFLNEGEKIKAIKNIYAAYYIIAKDIERRYLARFMSEIWFSYHDYSDEVISKYSDLIQDINDNLNKIVDLVEELKEILKIVILGVNYLKYTKFKKITRYMTFDLETTEVRCHGSLFGENPLEDISEEDIRFCFDFVIDFALTTQKIFENI